MPVWSEPQNLKTSLLRAMSFRGTVFLLAVLAIAMSEVRFNWVERLVGRYLVAANAYRPELGSVWDQGRLKQIATQTLEQMVTQQLSVQRDAREATSLTQLIDGLAASQGAMISAAHFKTLYSQIPESVARTLFSPMLLLRISSEKNWERTYLERENGQVGIYLLDRANHVLSYTTVSDRELKATGTEPTLFPGALEDQPEFAGRIYPADRFFMALETLPPDTQRGVISQPGLILANEGTPVRVGFSDEVTADRIRIGVEVETPQGRQTLVGMGQEWAVWQVRMLLEPQLSQPTSPSARWPMRRTGGGDP